MSFKDMIIKNFLRNSCSAVAQKSFAAEKTSFELKYKQSIFPSSDNRAIIFYSFMVIFPLQLGHAF